MRRARSASGATPEPPVRAEKQGTGVVTRSLVGEVAAIRKRDVDKAVQSRINRANGDCSIEQINAWEADAYREWRRQWPLLNNILFEHGDVG